MANVRLASRADRAAVVDLVGKLLAELGGTPSPAEAMSPTFDFLAGGGDVGFVALGESDSRAVAVCTVSYLRAMRTRGKYAIIQEMYVEPEYRSTGVGMGVLKFALDYAVANGCQTVELGTPYHGDRQIQFYRRAGFTEVGARLRWRAGQ
ncbi:MAG: GNAT family N-acetyltransferase [Chloroflexi bacterium]|nr:GNAT family N-acetyltransferase [Chloroflexota bacterium]